MSLMSTPGGRASFHAKRQFSQQPTHRLPDVRGDRVSSRYTQQEVPLSLRSLIPFAPSPREQMRKNRDTLPVSAFAPRIISSLLQNEATVIVAETGAGKSTQVPQMLLEHGLSCIVTQPRRVAAASVAGWVAHQQLEPLGELIGFRHSLGGEHSVNSKVTFTTDGYELSRLLGSGHFPADVLVIDEVHEANPNMEALLALWKKLQGQGLAPRLVVMSATMNANKIARYLGTKAVINIPGRTFPVEELSRGESLASDICQQVTHGRNCLVFLPGKQEIAQIQEELCSLHLDAEIIPLHGMLSAEEQDRAFGMYTRPKVVLATNVAQTSITIDDIDCVIDSGLERQLYLVRGVESLLISEISQHDALQRKGRAGRTKPGHYIYHGPVPFEDLEREPIPAIQRVPVATLMLRLLAGGEHIDRMHFLHSIPQQHIEQATELLYLLDLIGPQGHITERGRVASKLPVKERMGKMIAHALEHWPRDQELLDNVLRIAAISEVQGVTLAGATKRWREFCPFETESDHIAQLLVYWGATSMNKDELSEHGIDPISFRRARQVEELLRRRLELLPLQDHEDSQVAPERWSNRVVSEPLRRRLLECIWSAHVDAAYERKYSEGRDVFYRAMHSMTQERSSLRKLGRESIVAHDAQYVIGRDFDLAVLTDLSGESRVLELVLMASKVDPEWLQKHRPAALKKTYDGLNTQERRRGGKAKRKERLPSRARSRR